MIGFVAGALERVSGDHVVVSVGGLGFEVHCHSGVLATMPPNGSPVRLYTDLQVRNEALRLYGFVDARERAWFRLLVGVQQVGAKGALSILGAIGANGISDAVAVGDPSPVQRAPGIGRKLAERVVRELRGKAPELEFGSTPRASGPIGQARADMVSALVNLGYSRDIAAEAAQAELAALASDEVPELAELLRGALRRLGRRSD